MGTNINEVKLGDTKFYLKIPDGFNVTEARGKEGQYGFNILPKSTTSKMFGFIEIEHGHPINDSNETLKSPQEYIQSTLLNVPIKWAVYVTNSGYFDAESEVVRGVSGSASSFKRHEIDSLISIVQTLSER